jgi:hypothetical protein
MTLVRLARRPALIPLDELLATARRPRTPPRRRRTSRATTRGRTRWLVSWIERGFVRETYVGGVACVGRRFRHQAGAHHARLSRARDAARSPPIERAHWFHACHPPPPVRSQGRAFVREATSSPLKSAPNTQGVSPSAPLGEPLERLPRDPLTRVGEVAALRSKAILEHAVRHRADVGPNVTLLFESASRRTRSLGAQSKEPEALAILTRCQVRAHFGKATHRGPRPSMVQRAHVTVGAAGPTLATPSMPQARKARVREGARKQVKAHPLVARRRSVIFGAELREVRIPRPKRNDTLGRCNSAVE